MTYRKLHLSRALLDSLRKAQEIVVVTGSGLGVASGLPASRDGINGLWSRHDPAALATAAGFRLNPAAAWNWHASRRVSATKAMPNAAHHAISALAVLRPLTTVITQNGDALHERAQTPRLLHLHGTLDEAHCSACGVPHTLPAPDDKRTPSSRGPAYPPPPTCRLCAGVVRPSRLWHGERPHAQLWRTAHIAATSANLVLAVGTSCQSPTASDLCYAALGSGAALVQINPNATAMDRLATHTLRGKAEDILPLLLAYAWPNA